MARQGGTLADIGANLGYFALLWAASKPSNKCIAFEASPRNVGLLRRNEANLERATVNGVASNSALVTVK